MIRLKSPKEIETLAEGGRLLAEILRRLERLVSAGVVPHDLDIAARKMIAAGGAEPSFLGYAPSGHERFPAALCVSVNQAVVHGIPSMEPMREGDLVSLDLGIIYKGLYLDAARTVGVGNISAEAEHLLRVTTAALHSGIEAARAGNKIGDVGSAVQGVVEREGLSVVRQLVGHGVGFAVHEDPRVPNYGYAGKGQVLKSGLVIAIEPMVVRGDPTVVTASDGWTVETASGGLAAHEEHTVAVTPAGPLVLTQL